MSKCELMDLHEKISKPNTRHEYFSDSIDFAQLINQFQFVENQDRPDGIILAQNTVYIIEHFQISIYGRKNKGDKLQEALSEKNVRKMSKEINLLPENEDWETDLISNWYEVFSFILDKHMRSYQVYEENALVHYKDREHKFILVIEDTSNSIVTDDDLSVLDISEFVEKVLSYPQIDGVITFKANTRGSSVIAKDRARLQADKDSGNLCSTKCAYFLMLIQTVGLDNLSLKQKENIMEQLCHCLGKSNESICLREIIQIEKH